MRDAVLEWSTPLVAARISSGWAAFRAAAAEAWSPEAMASSTLRMKLRTRERRDLLTAVRAAILRVAFFAEVVLAIYASLQKSDTNSTLAVPGHCDLSSKQFGSNIGKPWNSAFQTVGGV
ncbi:protein of unknown function [Shinella sp. WSC3-e]|nr:protein of unknown function [Shinella sp. WSC3-e]